MAPSIHYLSHGFVCGYGTAGRRLLLALDAHGVEVTWTPLVFDDANPVFPDGWAAEPSLARFRGRPTNPDVVVIHATPEMIPALEPLRPPGGAVVAHTVWEHEQLQPHWPALLNRCDGVIVPTSWNAEAFRAAGVTVPVGVVPHVAATDDHDPPDHGWLGPAGLDLGDRLVVHSIAAWTDRKQPEVSVEAFARAFTPDDDVVLVLKTDRTIGPGMPCLPGPPRRRNLTSWTTAAVLHRNHPAADVELVHDQLTYGQVAALHRRSDCWLSLPHSEGWDLGAFDAAVAGTPVVTTRYGGVLAYLDERSPLLIPGAEVPNPAVAGTTWLAPDVDAAVEALRWVAADPGRARAAAEAHASTIGPRYAPRAVAQVFLDVLVEMGIG